MTQNLIEYQLRHNADDNPVNLYLFKASIETLKKGVKYVLSYQ